MKLSLSAKFHLTLIPLALMGVLVAWITKSSLRDNAHALIQARQVKELAVTSLALLLTQDDASKALMLDSSNTDASMRKIQAYDDGQAVFKELAGMAHSPNLERLIQRLTEIDELQLRPLDTKLLETMSAGNAGATLKLFATEYEPVRAKYEATLRELVQAAEKEAVAAAQMMHENNARSFQLICGALIAGLAVVAAILLLVTRRVSRSLRETAGVLAREADSSAATSAQFRNSSRALAEGAGKQAASLEEISASLEEMSSMTKRNADHASTAKELSAGTRQAADSGASNMREMCDAMRALKESSAGISKIIKTIDEIAFQTNILALNAAVEAARAGEAGMGFAVVADGVRNLAQRSALAARETSDRIQDSIDKSERGALLSERVASSFGEIVGKARQVDDLIAQIAQSSSEQNQGIQQIAGATTQVDMVTQSNSAGAQEGAEAAERLIAQAGRVRNAVGELAEILGHTGQATPTKDPAPSAGKAFAVDSGRKESRVRARAGVASRPERAPNGTPRNEFPMPQTAEKSRDHVSF